MTDPTELMFNRLAALYAELQSQAENGRFEGSLVAVYDAVGSSRSHYGKLYTALEDLGCIEIERKGRSGLTSVLLLHKSPQIELFRKIHVRTLTKRDPSGILTLQQRVSNLEVAGKEGRVGDIDLSEALVNLERRLQALEGR